MFSVQMMTVLGEGNKPKKIEKNKREKEKGKREKFGLLVFLGEKSIAGLVIKIRRKN